MTSKGTHRSASLATPAPRQRRPATIDLDFSDVFRLRFEPPAELSAEVFASLCAANPELRLERTARGELEIMSPAGGETSDKNSEFNYQLRRWNKKAGKGLGKCFESSGGFILPNGATRSPDGSWLAMDRWRALTPAQRKVFLPLCPDFVAEIRSESEGLAKLRKKMKEYMAQGARLGWLIDPLSETVEVYRPGRNVQRLKRPATLSGEDVLPGFVLDLKGVLTDEETA